MNKTNMFIFTYHLSRQRTSWLILFILSLLPFSLALIFQHYLDMPPCVFCIYQRLALLGIGLAALLVFVAPKCRFLRAGSSLLWGYSAFRGLLAAWEQAQRYLYPSRFTTCPFRVPFPEWLPLDSWIPQVFKTYADCEPQDWSLLGLNMPQWMVLMFAAHLFIAVLVVCSQIISWRQDVRYLHNPK